MGLDSYIHEIEDPTVLDNINGHLYWGEGKQTNTTEIAYWRKAYSVHNWFMNYYANMVNSNHTDFNCIYCPINTQLLYNLKADIEDGHIDTSEDIKPDETIPKLLEAITTCAELLKQGKHIYFHSWY